MPKRGYQIVKGLFGKKIEMPEEWNFVTLNSIIENKNKVIDPFNFPDEEFELYSIPSYHKSGSPEIIFGKDIHSNKIFVDNNTALFGKINPDLPKIWFVLSSTKLRKIASTEFIPLKGNFKTDSKFLYYLSWSKFLYGICKSFVSGTTPSRERVEPKAFLKIFVPLPLLSEQQKIASILSNVDALIESTQDLVEKAEMLKKGLMQKLLIRGIGHTKFKKVKGMFRKENEIPEEWEVKKFGRVVKINPQTKIEQNTVPYIPMQAVDTKKPNFNYFEERKLSKNSNLSRFQNNDVLIARITPSIENGKTSIVENFRRSGIVSSELIVLRASKKVLPRYLYYYVKNYRIRQFAISQMMGTTGRQRVPNSVFTKDLNFELPPFSEQKQIASILSGIDAYIQKNQLWKAGKIQEQINEAFLSLTSFA